MYDEIKPRGASKGSDPNSGGAVIRETPVFGIVKDNVDPTRSGRIQVYISDLVVKILMIVIVGSLLSL